MKFVIFGAGGTGGVLGAYLAAAGNDVTFIARGEHLHAIKENGLLIKTDHRGDLLIKNAKACAADEYNETPDVIFVCVKYYALRDATAFVRRTATGDTLVIPILNVYGTGGIMQKDLVGISCLDGCIYVLAYIESPGVIAQPQSILRVFYGFRPGEDERLREKAAELETILRAAEIRAHFSADIRRDALQKFALISPMGAAGVYFDAVSEDFQKDGEIRDTFIGLTKEIAAIGDALGLVFERDLKEAGLRMIDAFKPGLRTSMQRDVIKGGPSEFDGLVHEVVRLGESCGVPVPLYKKISDWGRLHNIT